MYRRHSDIIGKKAFARIQKTSVMVAGAGGLGASVLNLLVRYGFGKIYFFDYATIDLPDLNRQILYDRNDIGKLKTEVASEKLKRINPQIDIIACDEKISEATSIPDVELVFDCLDNFTSRYILDKLVFPKTIPLVHAGVSLYYGQITVICAGRTKSLRDSIPVDAQKYDKSIDKQVHPALVTTIASLQVMEAVKFFRHDFDNMLFNKILAVDLLSNSFDLIEIR